jgi:DNA topoisomerase I
MIDGLARDGIRRRGSPARGFRYRHADGRAASLQELERIRALRIPPAWVDVRVAPAPRTMLQAVGRDRRGRWQYLYHAAHVARRERDKARRLLHFIEALPALRRAIARDSRLPGIPAAKVLAAIARILSTCFLRPGSREYADENGSYGIATLRRQHVTVTGEIVRFRFPGKSGKTHDREIRDRSLGRLIRRLVALPGVEVFKFRNDQGAIVDVDTRHINGYIKEIMGERFSAKDFRTWAGTLICACTLARNAGGEITATHRRKRISAAVKETAALLGNTPAVCRASYIQSAVLEHYERGRVIDFHLETVDELSRLRSTRLARAESALLTLLRSSASRSLARA